jgi:hypothetical protein
MKDVEGRDIEGLLRSVRLKPAPPGLRERVLKASGRAREEAAWTTPRLRRCLAGCAVVLAAVLISDAALNRGQQHRLQSFLGRNAGLASDSEREQQTTLNDLSDIVGAQERPWREWILAHQKESGGRGRAVFPGLSSREERNGGEMAKDIN